MEDPHNHFVHQSAAKRYANDRPYFHPLVIAKVRDLLPLDWPVTRALDVACGTGQSSVALRAIADTVIGVDPSVAMLGASTPERGVAYLAGAAERLPFGQAAFDLATVALAFHWFERAQFLAESRRVLQPGGWLVIYNNIFLGTMRENPAFATWLREEYLRRYPTPSRHNAPLTDDDASRHGFRFAYQERYTNDITFTAPALARYLLTQSNVIAAVEEGRETLDPVHAWLATALAPLFSQPTGTFTFGGTVWALQKLPARAARVKSS